MRQINLTLGLLTAALLSACGGGGSAGPTVSTSTARGVLVANPPNLVPIPQANGTAVPQLDPVTFAAMLNAAQPGLTQITGTPVCSISTYYMKYNTVGSKGEPATATGAIFVPSGSAAQCAGPRPVVVYAHGTTVTKSFNMANLQSNQEAVLVAATFAAQGYIVVAPNYAGYDLSSLPYTGYLDASQQSNDVIDSLRAARQAFPNIGAQDSGKLFLTGYSQGGYVALATQQSMQNNYSSEFKVTALAGGSGPYATSALADAIFAQQPNLGGTAFLPLITNAWQAHYGNIYGAGGDASNIYAAPYAATIQSLIPGNYASITDLYTSGALPATAMFSSTYGGVIGQVTYGGQLPAQLAPFYGSGNLVSDTFALGFLQDIKANPCTTMTTPATPLNCKPANTVRQAAIANDLRTLPVPTVPVLLCGGKNDPTVFFASTQAEQAFLAGNGFGAPYLSVLDVDSSPTSAADPFAAAKVGFATAKAKVAAAATAAGQTPAQVQATVLSQYHGALVPPFCNAAAAGFFQQFAK
ncbi:prolyl oligopeptidase family serine peptidase [Undibacterium jejuense]|uniref:Prolyl oligopeptidase family serine peptidase n=1 Tax=Undibacterium jejuense TaxID=1344949 RepID=A0A923HJS4_9BURK|nr:lipase family protein [Undibacterium jejuense]MBC3862099.1 prolyl oligopeptidase family serine peptidase [Undibacterium jejuense]